MKRTEKIVIVVSIAFGIVLFGSLFALYYLRPRAPAFTVSTPTGPGYRFKTVFSEEIVMQPDKYYYIPKPVSVGSNPEHPPALGFIIYCENKEANFVWWILDCDVETFERNIDDFFDYIVHQGAFESRLKMNSEDRTLESGGQYLFVLCQTNQFIGDIPVEVHVSIKEWQY